MAKYEVYGLIKTSKFIGEFEANSKEEAEKMAWDSDEAYVSLCYHCSREFATEIEVTEMVAEENN